jgi:hypothetical protein
MRPTNSNSHLFLPWNESFEKFAAGYTRRVSVLLRITVLCMASTGD